MEEKIEVLGTMSSPFITKKPVSYIKAHKSHMKMENNIINSSSKQPFLVEFNKENECENLFSPNLLLTKGLEVSRFTDGINILDSVELLEIENLLPDKPGSWLLDTQGGCHEDFDVISWLREADDDGGGGGGGGDDDVGFNKVPRFNKTPSLLYDQTNSQQSKDSTSSPVALQLETLRRRAKLLTVEDPKLPTNLCNTSATSLPVPDISPKKKPSMLVLGETKSYFGLRGKKLPSESEIKHETSSDSNPNDVTYTLGSRNDISQNSNENLPVVSSSFLNKSFDNVITAVTSSNNFMQKSMSKSQETCFSPGRVVDIDIDGGSNLTNMGQLSRGSLNKITNIEDVKNIAKLQADNLRQTLRGGFSHKRLSQSTDRLKHVSSNNLTDHTDQFKIPMGSDSDDNLTSKFKVPLLPGPKILSDSSTHPKSLPNIIPRSRMLQIHSKLIPPGSNNQQPKEFKISQKMPKASPPTKTINSPLISSKFKNVSSIRVPAAKVLAKPNVIANRSLDSASPSSVTTGLRTHSKLPSSKQVSRIHPPSGIGFRGEKSDSDRSIENVESGNISHSSNKSSGSEEGQGSEKLNGNKTFNVSSNSLQNSSTEDSISSKQSDGPPPRPPTTSSSSSSIPVPRGIPRLSSIPRPRTKQPTK